MLLEIKERVGLLFSSVLEIRLSYSFIVEKNNTIFPFVVHSLLRLRHAKKNNTILHPNSKPPN